MEDNLPDGEVLALYGDVDYDLTKRITWEAILERYNLVVSTPAILDHCLMRSYLNMSQISLIVFDEAHHAKKEHLYSRLMKSYYLNCDPEARPKIFGMTASPLDSKKDIQTTAMALESMLNARIVTTNDMSLLAYAPKPTDQKWIYSKLRLEFDTDLSNQLQTLVGWCNDFKRGFEFSRKATSQLGPWCADCVWKYIIGTASSASSGLRKRFEQSSAYSALPTLESRENALNNVDEAVLLIVNHELAIPKLDALFLSSKVIMLHDRLRLQYQNDQDTRAIVFVDERLRAFVLYNLFSRLEVPNMRPGVLIGSVSGGEASSIRDQDQTLNKFRTGDVNLIFATSVADEGLDIPECNLCIRFDLCSTTIQYMQSRGRARKKGSMFVHMIEEDNIKQENEVEYQIADEKYIKQWCSSLPSDRKLGHGTRSSASASRSFKTTSGAICDFHNSMLILSRFASSLEHITTTDVETYEEEIGSQHQQFRYVVRLPLNNSSKVKGCKGEWQSNKRSAKRSAAFGCCVLLRRNGELDEDLNSAFKKSKPANSNAHLAVSEKKSSYEMQVKPLMWNDGLGTLPAELFVLIITFHPSQTLARAMTPLLMLTRPAVPKLLPFDIFLDSVPVKVELQSIDTPFRVTNEQLTALSTFTLNAIFEDVFNKRYACEPSYMSYWIAPMRPLTETRTTSLDHLVDFDVVNAACVERTNWSSVLSNDRWLNRFLCDPRNGKFHYFSRDIVPSMSILDKIPSNFPKVAGKGVDSIIEFSDSSWTGSKRKALAGKKYDKEQPVISAELVGVQRNFLIPSSNSLFTPCLIAPRTLEIGRLSPEFAMSCLAWPTIIHCIEEHLLARECLSKLKLQDIPTSLALEALTKGTQGHDDDVVENGTDSLRSRNYERLEFIGDSLLKMMTTITIFTRTLCDEEGMHCRRMGIICNQHLFNVASTQFELHKYARTQVFNRNTWYPENLLLLKGRGAKKDPQRVKHSGLTHDLSMKTIADMAEAIIGAAVTASVNLPTEQKFDLGIQAITRLVNHDDHNIFTWSDVRSLYQAPLWSLQMSDPIANDLVEKIHSKTGYRFKHPCLLRSAFTHSSDTNSPVPNLQRLEFLGDAVLDWVCISWLFYSNPSRGPQWLTEHKIAMVSNKFLACLAVVLEFDKFMFITTVDLLASVSSYADVVRESLARHPPGSDSYSPSFWTNIDHPPKAMSDLVESYLGALLIDSNWDFSLIEDFFERHIKDFFVNIEAYDTFANRHPTTYVHKILGGDFKCCDFRVMDGSLPEKRPGEPRYMVGIVIHGEVVASSEGSSTTYARVRASKALLAKLEGVTAEVYRREWHCDCSKSAK